MNEPICTQEQLDTIVMIAKQLAPQFVFPGHVREDMIQVGIMIGLKVLPKYNPTLPLENFMRVHMRRRLINYKRDNYCRYEKVTDPDRAAKLADTNKMRQNLMSPIDVDEVAHTITHQSVAHEEVAFKELVQIIQAKLPAKLRADYLRMLDDVSIPGARRIAVQEAVMEIMREYHEED